MASHRYKRSRKSLSCPREKFAYPSPEVVLDLDDATRKALLLEVYRESGYYKTWVQFQNINLVKDITLPQGLSICFYTRKTLMGALETRDMALQVKTDIFRLTRIDINHRFSSAYKIIWSFGCMKAMENGNPLKLGTKIMQISC